MYNATFDNLWGYGPIAAELWMAAFAECDGEMVGFRVGFPQYEPVFRMLDGELTWHKYPRLPFAMRRVREGISLIVGVRAEARGRGIAPSLSLPSTRRCCAAATRV